MSNEELHWLVGYLEGEGCFSIGRRKKNNMLSTPMVSVVTTDHDIAVKVALMIGAKSVRVLPKKENHKQVYALSIHGDKAIALMTSVCPYMGERRKARIEEVLELAASRPGIARGEKTGQSMLTDEQASSIRLEYAQNPVKGMQTKLAQKYGMRQSSVWCILNGRTYTAAARK